MGWAGPERPGQKCSLGYEVAAWIETYLCHGPGDVQGEPIELDSEWLTYLVNAYELDPDTGRRRVDEGVLSRPKGRAKSELAGLVGCAEAFGPVRFDDWDANGQPVGRPVTSPLLKCLATEESQAGNTFENIAFIAGQWGPDVHPDIFGGVSGIRQYQSATALYIPGGGEIRACTSGAASKDGGKETWVCADETHLYVLRELKAMYATVKRNLGKRKLAQPWLMQTTTAYQPGELSVAEETLTAWKKGELPSTVLVDHRQATGRIDLLDAEHTMAQLREVYGDAAGWMDLERIYREMLDPRVCPDEATAARYFLNRAISTKGVWIPADVVERQARPDELPDGELPDGEHVALGFDGSLNEDSTVLIASRMRDGFLVPLGIWEKPAGEAGKTWEVPRAEVLAAIRLAFERLKVTRLYGDPHEWRSDLDALAEEFPERVITWPTTHDVRMAAALDRLHVDLLTGEQVLDADGQPVMLTGAQVLDHEGEPVVTPDGEPVFDADQPLQTGVLKHSGDGRFMQHLVNAYTWTKGRHRLVRKEADRSPRKIDSTVGAALAYEARADAIAAGWTDAPEPRRRIVVRR